MRISVVRGLIVLARDDNSASVSMTPDDYRLFLDQVYEGKFRTHRDDNHPGEVYIWPERRNQWVDSHDDGLYVSLAEWANFRGAPKETLTIDDLTEGLFAASLPVYPRSIHAKC